MKKFIKYLYLVSSIPYFIFINYISYNVEPYSIAKPLAVKLTFSIISAILFIIILLLLIRPSLIYKKEIKLDTKIALYIGIIIVPLISLYY